MNKLDFITRQLAKAQRKRFEHYVVNRIWTVMDDTSIKFVTQQFVARPEGRAMTDMYFPQLGVHIEVDEGFHKHQLESDKLREADIVNATEHQVLRVDVTKEIEIINADIAAIVAVLRSKKANIQDFEPWNLESEMNPRTYIEKGFVDVADDVAFRTQADAAACFGRERKSLQSSYIHHPVESGKRIWFPKLYENEDWDNRLSLDEDTITEFCLTSVGMEKHFAKSLKDTAIGRLTFARVRSPMGDVMYRYKGEFRMDRDASSVDDGVIFRRISKRSKTYSSLHASK